MFLSLINRGKYIFFHQSWIDFFKSGFSYMRSSVFDHGSYLIYEREMDTNQKSFESKPKIDCSFKLISNIEELNKLISQNYNFKAINFQSKLLLGALAFCLFVGKDLGTVTWVAFNNKAKQEIDKIPFFVNFEKGEVCSGASFTDPQFRGNYLHNYNYSFIINYLINKGIKKCKFSIIIGNIASQKVSTNINSKIIGKWSYSKILLWEFFKEQKLEGLNDTRL